ncbi:3'-5' exonuclease [Companilactobacillus kimchii]|uniref:3'-5' exonuclease n=1 Tax=Companilactobacillus kimchii TaxID=2801452 RepID=UPI0021F1B4FC|nr:3'-5' exonuclease [Companilactobacillus kimchii]
MHQFINFIQRMQDLDKDLSQPNSIEATDDTVKVMTVHASKGLEFPIVIYLDMAKQFNKLDFQGQTVFDTDQGIGITLINSQNRLKYSTIQHSVISNRRKVATTSEEMRLLYVALTRAKQKLIMFGFTKKVEDTINTWDEVSPKTGVINEAIRLKANNFQDLVGISTLSDEDRETVSDKLYLNKHCNLRLNLVYPEVKDDLASKIIIPKKIPVEPSDLFKKTVKQLLDFNYRYQESVDTTAYQSVSEIKGLFADPDDENMAEDLLEDKSRYNLGSFAKPQFLTKTKKVTAAEVGSATHLVLQKIKLDKTPEIADFQDLIQQMVNEKLLTDELAEKIDCQSLANFYQSNLGQVIIEHHNDVSREFPCSILMPAQKLFKNSSKDYSINDKILVHGIIDGVIELDHGIIIFDYKTDHVTDQNFEELVSKYSGQVNLYAEAISVIKNKPVVGKYLYFLKISKAIDLQEK